MNRKLDINKEGNWTNEWINERSKECEERGEK